MNRLRYRRLWHFEKKTIRPGKYWNSPSVETWSYCGSFKAESVEEAFIEAMFKVGSSLVRIMPEGEDKGYL